MTQTGGKVDSEALGDRLTIEDLVAAKKWLDEARVTSHSRVLWHDGAFYKQSDKGWVNIETGEIMDITVSDL